MKMRSLVHGLLICGLASTLMSPLVQAAESLPGAIIGIVTNSAKLPVAQATVTAKTADGRGIRPTMSGSDGVYAFYDLPPGKWSITTHLDGSPDVTLPSIEVVTGQTSRHDIVISGA